MDRYNKILSDLRNCLKPTHDCMMCEYVDEDFSNCKNHLVSDIQKVFHEFLDLLSREPKNSEQHDVQEKYGNLKGIHQDLVEFCDDLMADNKALKQQISELNHKFSDWLSETPPAVNWHSVEHDGLPVVTGDYLVWVHRPLRFCGEDNGYVSICTFDKDQSIWTGEEYSIGPYNAILEYVDKNERFFVSHWAEKPISPYGERGEQDG